MLLVFKTAFAFQLIYSGNLQTFVQKSQINEVRVAIGIEDENFARVLEDAGVYKTNQSGRQAFKRFLNQVGLID